MEKYLNIAINSFGGYWDYLVTEISQPSWDNYFYWLLGLSLLVFLLEIIMPWRENKKIFRKGFWLDSFYIFFNFFLFSLIAYNALSNVGVALFNDLSDYIGIQNIIAFEVSSYPVWAELLIMLVIADFIQWNIHRLLHRSDFLWEFHKVHHSVKEMGFAAQFRFHFLETIVYKTLQYIPLAMIGFGIKDFFVIHMFSVLIGHLNHANIRWDYGIFRYILNNPKMHIWHHSRELPEDHRRGVNFGLTLSIWDYIFGTVYIPGDGSRTELGFEDDHKFPETFWAQ
ncbi:MAG TPA: sterol desaturase family protein, partial [Salinimicrobium sp.]|nr:sterol desaturase family protein [Salinimicrobium sp.]